MLPRFHFDVLEGEPGLIPNASRRRRITGAIFREDRSERGQLPNPVASDTPGVVQLPVGRVRRGEPRPGSHLQGPPLGPLEE